MSGSGDLEAARADLRGLERPLVEALIQRARYPTGADTRTADGTESFYRTVVLPALCAPGPDGPSDRLDALDRRVLELLRRRLRLGDRVADAKAALDPGRYAALVGSRDREGLIRALTDAAVERTVVERVRELATGLAGAEVGRRVAHVFVDGIIPRTKEVEADRLLGR